MEVVPYADPRRFRRDLLPLLMKDEVRHNLMLGLVDTLISKPDVYPEFGLWVVRSGGVPVAGALRTPPYNLVLSDLPDREAALALAEHLAGEELPGSVGVLPGGEWFAEAFAGVAGRTPTPTMRQGIFALERVQPVPIPDGRARAAVPAELQLLVPWVVEFSKEALADDDPPRDRIEEMAGRRLSGDDPLLGFWVWEVAGDVVSLSGHGGTTPNGIRIGPVYTPPEHRGSGYATALVAAESQWLLDQGRTRCFLYTDLSNPTSNAIYRRIGYEMAAESVEYSFGRREAPAGVSR